MNAVDPEILARLDQIEAKLRRLLVVVTETAESEQRSAEAEERSDWVDSVMFCHIAGIKSASSLTYFMSKGIFTNNSIRNVGTVKKPRYRFHRRIAVEEFLNRSQIKLP